jgi:hypothetical protein
MSVAGGQANLFTAQGSDANGAAVDWVSGDGVFSAYGTFGGGTCKLQWSPDAGTTWFDVDKSGDTYTTLTAAGAGAFRLPTCKIRAVLSGATAPTLTALAAGLPA